jgi:hypothetical protein
MSRYIGKRFAGLLLVTLSLLVGFLCGSADGFGSLSSTLGLMYGAYVTGQSFTDSREPR